MLFNLEKPAPQGLRLHFQPVGFPGWRVEPTPRRAMPAPHCGSQKQLAVPGNYSSGIMECWNEISITLLWGETKTGSFGPDSY